MGERQGRGGRGGRRGLLVHPPIHHVPPAARAVEAAWLPSIVERSGGVVNASPRAPVPQVTDDDNCEKSSVHGGRERQPRHGCGLRERG